MQHLRTIVQQLRIANLTVKPQKCQLDMAECVYLGHVVDRGGVVRPELCKVEAIQAFSQPATKKQVKAFLGITGYYRKFIPNYSALAAPLTGLTKNRPTRNFGLWIGISKPQFHNTIYTANWCVRQRSWCSVKPTVNRQWPSSSCILQEEAAPKGRKALHNRKRVSCSEIINRSLSVLSHGTYIYISNWPPCSALVG